MPDVSIGFLMKLAIHDFEFEEIELTFKMWKYFDLR